MLTKKRLHAFSQIILSCLFLAARSGPVARSTREPGVRVCRDGGLAGVERRRAREEAHEVRGLHLRHRRLRRLAEEARDLLVGWSGARGAHLHGRELALPAQKAGPPRGGRSRHHEPPGSHHYRGAILEPKLVATTFTWQTCQSHPITCVWAKVGWTLVEGVNCPPNARWRCGPLSNDQMKGWGVAE